VQQGGRAQLRLSCGGQGLLGSRELNSRQLQGYLDAIANAIYVVQCVCAGLID
jgi:hypothetical protein